MAHDIRVYFPRSAQEPRAKSSAIELATRPQGWPLQTSDDACKVDDRADDVAESQGLGKTGER